MIASRKRLVTLHPAYLKQRTGKTKKGVKNDGIFVCRDVDWAYNSINQYHDSDTGRLKKEETDYGFHNYE